MNDADDFEQLWRTHFASVARTAFLIVGDAEEASDISQEAFVRALQHWRKVGKLEKPEGWVHRVATNLALSWRRRKAPVAPERRASEPATEPPDDELLTALMSITPQQRAVVALRFYLDWSVEDVATALHKRPGTVRALTSQGIERLREALTKESQHG